MKNDRGLAFVGRLLMAILFIAAGLGKLFGFAMTAAYFGSLGMPMPQVATVVAILVELGGGLALLAGFRLVIVATIMGVFTLATALIGHQFWAADPAQFNGQLNNFLKNVAMAGGFLMMLLFDWQQRANAKAAF